MWKKLKKRVVSRALPLFLAVLMVFPSAPITGISAGEDEGKEIYQSGQSSLVYDYDTLKLTIDGEEIDRLSIYPYEKIDVDSTGLEPNQNITYQWQIKHPEKNNLWVDIYDAKSDSIGVSVALINNMLTEDGTAALRLRAYTEDYAYLSNTLTVSIKDEQPSEPALSVDKITFPHAMAGDTSDTPEFVTVTIEYEKYEYHYDSTLGKYKLDYMGPAFSSYIATLRYGSPLISDSAGISVPDIVGFAPVLVAADGITLTGNKAFLNIPSVTENLTFTIKYMPEKVDYEVRYRFQNVYDDSYVTDTSITDVSMGITNGIYYGEGYTGLPPYMEVDGEGNLIENDEKIGVYAEFDGFAPLYYQPDTIAADGSTVFEVYYERTYYLMEFDCAGGYGAHTLYVRHGTYIYVPDPIRTGYVFLGWDKLDPITGNGDGVADELPTNMPIGNTAYIAIWTTTQTTYTVVYWIDNGDGTKTYIGSRPVTETSAEKVSGSDDLTADTNVCGFEEHTHTDCTISCGKTEHTHGDDCCSVPEHIHGADCCDMDEHSHGDDCCSVTEHTHGSACYSLSYGSWGSVYYGTPTGTTASNGIVRAGGNNYYYKIGDIWYRITGLSNNQWAGNYYANVTITLTCTDTEHVHGDGTCDTVKCGNQAEHTHGDGNCNSANCSQIAHTHGDGNCVYCSADEHTHAEKCYSCGKVAHTHSASCKNSNAPYMEFVKADQNVTVEGDGSTIVNVYYQYKTYTIRFIYARTDTSGGNVTIATSTGCGQYNNIHSSEVDHNGSNYGNGHQNVSWSTTVTSLPQITDDYYNKTGNNGYFTEGDNRYYYIALTAKYGESIETIWPDASIGSATASGGATYYFGSWGAECASEYRKYNAEHANIVGPYPVMSAEMIVDPDNSIAQTMVAWWGGSHDYVEPHAYHIYYEVFANQKDDTGVVELNGRYYKLNRTQVFTAAHNGTTRVDPFFYNGFTIIESQKNGYSNSKSEDFHHPNCSIDSTADSHDYCNNFYYNRNTHSLSLYSYNAIMEGKGNGSAPFGMKLNEHEISATDMQNNYYPEGIEPGAYVFGGWYTTPDCITGTEVDWDTLTMPDGDLTVYAKWTPVVRNITFHLLYTDIAIDKPWYPPDVDDADKADYYPIKVPHGDLLGTAYSYTPTRDGDYQFIGWFYFDENGKKKFAPDSMKVTRDLILFAEWHSSIVTTYEVEYQAYKYVDGGSGDQLLNAEIASPLNDYSTAGKTVTFNAKGGKAMYDGYQSKWFPDSSSHSILMNADSSQNTHTFKYYNKDYINYKVMYINRITGDILGETGPIQTENAVVTEKFKPFSGYIPEEYYIEKSIAYDPTDYTQYPDHVSDENIIYFYYVPDTENALHRFEHYTETLVEGDYTLYSADQGPHKIDEVKKAKVEPITGFELVKIEITTYSLDSGTWVPHLETVLINNQTEREYYIANGIERAVTLGGLDIKFYYDRVEYNYTIQYVEDVDNSNVLHTVTAKARYGTTVSHTAPASYLNEGDAGDDGLLYIYRDGIDSTDEKRTAEKVITDDAAKNVLTFVYAKKRITVEYHIVCDVEALKAFNSLDIANETVVSGTDPMGCRATPGTGFVFKGWYYDKECTQEVPDAWVTVNENVYKLVAQTVEEGPDGKEHFYAKFEPISGSVQITKDVTNPDTNTANQSFLFLITGQDPRNSYVNTIVSVQGEGSVIITNLPIGNYDITELTGWSWEYSTTNASLTDVLVEADTQTNVTFTNTDNDPNWLNGEASNENVFN